MDPSLDLLPPLHPPGRSRTLSAWSALIALFLLILFGFFYSFILQKSIDALLWVSRPFTGITIHAETLPVKLGEKLRWKNIVMTSGREPHQSHLEFQRASLELTSPGRMIFGDHLLIQKLEASTGKGLLDLRQESSSPKSSFLEQQTKYLRELFQEKINTLPSSLILQDLSLLCITEKERYNIDHFSCSLPHKELGNISYQSLFFEAGRIRCDLPQARCDAYWDGKTITLKNLLFAEEMLLHHLELMPYTDRLEFGFAATLFHGLLRADGCFRKNGPGPTLEGAVLGEHLPLEKISSFLGLQKKISGTLREGRLTFRGSPLEPIDAEASLRMLVDHFRLKKKEWASLSIASNFIGRKISVTECCLKQQENQLTILGELSLPEEWHKIGQAPFHCKLKATITDASQLTDMIGPPWNDITGAFFMDGDITGGANRAEGYLHLQGTEMSCYGLPIDVMESNVLFQGEKTRLSNLDLWNGSSHLQLSGIMANSWPHTYDVEGGMKCRNFFEKLKSLEKWTNGDATHSTTSIQHIAEDQRALHAIPSGLYKQRSILKNICGGLLQVHWKGHGTAATHEGSFEIGLEDALEKNQPLQFQCTGSYTPDLLTCPKLKIHSGERTFSTSLFLSSHAIHLPNVRFQENQHCTLSGIITLPCDAMGLLRGHPLSSLLEWTTPMEVNLTLHHFPLDEIALFTGLPQHNTWMDGTIQSVGLWSAPSLEVVLQGRTTASKNCNHSFHLQLSSKQGAGFINATLQNKDATWMKLQGNLPLGLTRTLHREGEALLKTEDQPSLAPAPGALHLDLTLSDAPLDLVSKALLPHEIQLQNSALSGEIGLQGTVATPELSGHLSLQAEQCTLGSIIPPLHALKAGIVLSKEKIILENGSAFLGKGKLEASGSSEGRGGEVHHQYQILGNDLLLYQKQQNLIQGGVALLLQGDALGGKLTGNINITELDWNSQCTMTPFLLPPGVFLSRVALSAPEISTWKSDLTLHDTFPQKKPASSAVPSLKSDTKKISIEKVDLHLLGPLLSPAPEGIVTFSNLSLQSPRGPMRFLQGTMNFSIVQPWQPYFELTTETKIDPYKMIAHFRETVERHEASPLEVPLLFVESTPALSQETAALLLAAPNHDSSSSHFPEEWITQLLFWIRQQEIFEPTTISEPASPDNTTSQLSEYLGFGGSKVGCHVEFYTRHE